VAPRVDGCGGGDDAILQREPERRSFIEAIEAADARLMSVATFVEISIVIEARHGAEGLRDLDHFIGRATIEFVAVGAEHGKTARSAFSRFGKGRHRAAAPLIRSMRPTITGSAFRSVRQKHSLITTADVVYARANMRLKRRPSSAVTAVCPAECAPEVSKPTCD
jgi:hypothetical protein